MKRKLSSGLRDAAVPAQNKKVAGDIVVVQAQSCCLLQLLAQYGLLAAIASNLFPKDLYALAATSKAVYNAIFTCRESHTNLLGKMACDGRGIDLRRKNHNESRYLNSYDTILRPFKCHTQSGGVPARPCSKCKHMTCDECRIHCVYQATYQDPDNCDEVPTLTGFALLSTHEMGILTPYTLGLDDCVTPKQQMVVGLTVPYHDMGYLDAPLTSATYANPESIHEVVNFELGRNSLRLSDNSTAPHPSSIIRPFWEVTEERKWKICCQCVEQWRETAEDGYCRCTLKEHFLDRWLCLPCYQQETEQTRDLVIPFEPRKGKSACNNCGDRVYTQSLRTMCVWCLGECLQSFPSPRI